MKNRRSVFIGLFLTLLMAASILATTASAAIPESAYSGAAIQSQAQIARQITANPTDFPIGAFEDFNALNPTSFSTLINDAKAHNLDGVMLTNGQAEDGGAYLSTADAKGFNVYMGPVAELNADWWWSPNVSVDIATARNIIYPLVDQLSNHESLKGYYIVDEPSADQQTKVALAVQAFEERDPNRNAFPVLIGTDRVGPISTASKPKAMVIDVYPYGWRNPAGNTTMSGYGYSMDMVSYIRTVTAAKPASTPLWIILQGHRFGNGTGGFDLRQPSPAEARIENWIAIGEGAKGIFWFLYGSQPAQQLVGYKDNPALFTEISNLSRRVSSLRSLLLTLNKTTDRFTVSGSGNPYVSTLSDGVRSFAVVVNRSTKATSITVRSSLAGKLRDVETGKTYSKNVPISFQAGDGKILELVNPYMIVRP